MQQTRPIEPIVRELTTYGIASKMLTKLKQDRDIHHPNSPWVFHPNGIGFKEFRAEWSSACISAGLKRKVFHDFGRTAVRNKVRAGIPERVAQQMAGHRTRSVFKQSDVTSDTDLSEAAKRQADYISNETVAPMVTIRASSP
jgi:integrase